MLKVSHVQAAPREDGHPHDCMFFSIRLRSDLIGTLVLFLGAFEKSMKCNINIPNFYSFVRNSPPYVILGQVGNGANHQKIPSH